MKIQWEQEHLTECDQSSEMQIETNCLTGLLSFALPKDFCTLKLAYCPASSLLSSFPGYLSDSSVCLWLCFSLLVCLASFRAPTSCPNLTSKAFGSVWHPRQVSAGQPWRLEIKDSSSRFFEDAVCTGSTWGRESVIDLLDKKWSISNCRHSLEEDPHWAPLVYWTLHTNRSGGGVRLLWCPTKVAVE